MTDTSTDTTTDTDAYTGASGDRGREGTALVLGGGGLAGIGWETGILHGLAEAGVDLFDADLVVGTSAGSLVGAQLSGGLLSPRALWERQLGDPSGEPVGRLAPAGMVRFAGALLRSTDVRAYRRRVAAFALATDTRESEADRKAVIADRLVSPVWPGRRLLITAVDTATGALKVFDRDSGVDLVDAVAASCAVPGVWPPITIGAERYVDGGIRSSANADLARGRRRVVVIAPMALGTGLVPHPAAQVARLREEGARVALITPNAASKACFGRNPLDPARREPAARAGLAQAAEHAAEVKEVWGS
ncbi:patatin-like phospholipase family protein [Streptomyces sp. BI20]|uniref:patatin-like phospholipase family protein n=1 Tax=Streptomyces sp. BI20 TaxID=3403460 RepID=UPI003C76CC0E